jgi:predicted nucleotidyltransferase
MMRDEIISRIRNHAESIRALGAESEFLLKDILGAEVDLSARTALHPSLSRDTENTAIKVL